MLHLSLYHLWLLSPCLFFSLMLTSLVLVQVVVADFSQQLAKLLNTDHQVMLSNQCSHQYPWATLCTAIKCTITLHQVPDWNAWAQHFTENNELRPLSKFLNIYPHSHPHQHPPTHFDVMSLANTLFNRQWMAFWWHYATTMFTSWTVSDVQP